MKICPNCGAELRDDMDVCNKCGALSDDLQNLLDELTMATGLNKDKKNNVRTVKDEEIKSDDNVDDSQIVNPNENDDSNPDKIIEDIDANLNEYADNTVEDETIISEALKRDDDIYEKADISRDISAKTGDESNADNDIDTADDANEKSDSYDEEDEKSDDSIEKYLSKEDIIEKENISYQDIVIPAQKKEKDNKDNDNKQRRKTFALTLVILLLAASLGGGYAYYQTKLSQDSKKMAKVSDNEKKDKDDETKKDDTKMLKEANEEEEKKKQEELKKQEEEANRLAQEEEARKKAEEEARKQEEAKKNALDTPNADGTYNDEPQHLHEEDVPEGDARLYWVSDRTLTPAQLQAVANKFGADWTINYIYAKNGLIFEDGSYDKYGFNGDTYDRNVAASRFNGAERRNTNALANY